MPLSSVKVLVARLVTVAVANAQVNLAAVAVTSANTATKTTVVTVAVANVPTNPIVAAATNVSTATKTKVARA